MKSGKLTCKKHDLPETPERDSGGGRGKRHAQRRKKKERLEVEKKKIGALTEGWGPDWGRSEQEMRGGEAGEKNLGTGSGTKR